MAFYAYQACQRLTASGRVEELTTAPNVTQPDSQLSQILTTHVVDQRMDSSGLTEAGTVERLQGSTLTISGTAPELTVESGGVTANVVRANVPTANATVFLLDQVVMPQE